MVFVKAKSQEEKEDILDQVRALIRQNREQIRQSVVHPVKSISQEEQSTTFCGILSTFPGSSASEIVCGSSLMIKTDSVKQAFVCGTTKVRSRFLFFFSLVI